MSTIQSEHMRLPAKVSAAPGPRWCALNMPIEVRPSYERTTSGDAVTGVLMIKKLDATFEGLLRELAPQVLGVITRRFRDFASAEDAVQEAMIAAFTQWPQEGVPDNPRGWLIQFASRRMVDQARSEIARRDRETAVAAETVRASTSMLEVESDMDPDDTLVLLLMCCHPALCVRPRQSR